MKESLDPTSYKEPSLEYFCDSLIREKYKIIHIGMISNVDTFGKDLLAQQKEKYKPPKKQKSQR